MRRIVTARDQYEQLAPWPWLREAADYDISGYQRPTEPRPPSYGEQGNQPVPKPTKPLGPTVDEAPAWAAVDWKTATDYGHFHSTSRPPMSSDIPHPSEVLDPSNSRHTEPRTITQTNQKTGEALRYHLPSLWDCYQNSADPERDPYGVQTPFTKIEHVTPERRGPRGGRIKSKVTDVTEQMQNPNTAEDQVNNTYDHHTNQTPEQAYEGRVWYRASHEDTKNLADATTGEHERTVHTISAYSPKTPWDKNLENGYHFVTNHDPRGVGPLDEESPQGRTTTPVLPGMTTEATKKAVAISHLPDGEYQKVNSGPKTSSFANNILDKRPLREPRPGQDDDAGYYEHDINPFSEEPDFRFADPDVTVDTHDDRMKNTKHGDADALRSLRYGTDPRFSASFTVGGREIQPGYDLRARQTAEATQRINLEEPDPYRHLTHKQIQGGTWGKFKSDLDAAKGRTMPEPGEQPRGLQDRFRMKKNIGRDPEEVEREWGDKHPLTDPLPRYQKDRGSWWNDLRTPEMGEDRPVPVDWKGTVPSEETKPGGLRSLPGWANRPRDEEEWRNRDYNQHLTERWGDPGERGRWARVASSGGSLWDSILADYIARHPQHGDSPEHDPHLAAYYGPSVQETVAYADRILTGMVSQASTDDVLSYSAAILKNATVGEEAMDYLRDHPGGITFKRHPGKDQPSTGYMVSRPHEEKIIPFENLSAGEIDAFHGAHPSIADPNSPDYYGGWHQHPDWYHDLSEKIEDSYDAGRATVDRDQEGMFDNYKIHPHTRQPLPDSYIPRSDVANSGVASAMGFTMAKRRRRR